MEKYACNRGVTIKVYHADNNIFKSKKWVEAFHKSGQGLTFVGSETHDQIGMEEGRIRDLKELNCTVMIHANRRFPKSVMVNLWPYALHMANNVMNKTPIFPNPGKKIRK